MVMMKILLVDFRSQIFSVNIRVSGSISVRDRFA